MLRFFIKLRLVVLVKYFKCLLKYSILIFGVLKKIKIDMCIINYLFGIEKMI